MRGNFFGLGYAVNEVVTLLAFFLKLLLKCIFFVAPCLMALRSFIRFVMIPFMCNCSFGGLVFVKIGHCFITF